MEQPPNIDNITLDEVLYDLRRLYSHAKNVYDGNIDGRGLSKSGAFRRMQVLNFAINNILQSYEKENK